MHLDRSAPAETAAEQDPLSAHRASVIRLSAILYLVGMLITASVAYLPSMHMQVHFVTVAVPAVYLFPWRRFRINAFILVGAIA